MRRMSMLVIGLIALVFAVAAAGCGGGGDNSAATTEAVTTEAATTEEATTEEATTEEATTEEATTEAETDQVTTTDVASAFAAGKCRELAESVAGLSAAFSGTGTSDPKKLAAFYQELVEKVPSEVKADFQVLGDYVAKYAEVAGDLKAGETPDPATIAKLQEFATQIDQQKLTQASTNISAWVQKGCSS